ncbi:MAG: prolyl oligopeptidase family serine peptidase [Clostridia bacterium]|nr:prolyl oligopeptidase family serine peptidase [Clostridia bacterium]
MSDIKVLGKLPDPFLREDGTRVTPAEWPEYKKGLRDFVVKHEFGGMPKRPDSVKIQRLTHERHAIHQFFRVTAYAGERQISFILGLELSNEQLSHARNKDGVRYPVLLTGDGCYPNCEGDSYAMAQARGFIVAKFNRLELAHDDPLAPREGGVYDLYPEDQDFTAISAWAWGYSTVLDALEQIPYVDAANVGITGHSRGGKTVLLAAATDERFRFVCPNNSGTHGCAAYRYVMSDVGPKKARTEELGDMLDAFPHWMGKSLWEYRDRVQDLPYDMHYFGALIAPRYYLQCEGMQDYWINPNGSRQTFEAVKACYRYLGCEDHAAAWFRPGEHRQKLPDFEQFVDFMYRVIHGLPLAEHLQIDPYPNEPLIFDF